MKFQEFLEFKYISKEDDLILEFANMSPRMHNFGVDVKLHVFQPGYKQLNHGPRVKVFKTKDLSFTITLEKEPRVIGDYKGIVTKQELNKLIEKIKKYRNAFIQFWNDPDMDTDELYTLFVQIDKKFTVEEQ